MDLLKSVVFIFALAKISESRLGPINCVSKSGNLGCGIRLKPGKNILLAFAKNLLTSVKTNHSRFGRLFSR